MSNDKTQFEFQEYPTMDAVRAAIRGCEGRHVQQVAFSSFMDTLTQICFTCTCIRSTVRWSGNRSWSAERGEK